MDGERITGGARRPRAGSLRSNRGVRIVAAILAVAAAVVLFDGGFGLLRGAGPAASGTTVAGPTGLRVTALSGVDLGGGRVRLTRLEGRPLVVTFFGSWCAPCRREAAVFPAIVRRFGGRVSILAVAVSDTASRDRRFARRYGWTWPIVEDTGFGWSVAFGLMGVPGTYVLDARGRIADRMFGPADTQTLAADLGKLLPSG